MYASRTTQLFVGVFTLIGIAALIFLSVRLGRVEIFPAPGYTLFANFDNIAGLKTGDEVELAGVKIGKVSSLGLDGNRARIGMHINDGVEIDNEAIASVLTSGLIGDKYVSIALGGGDDLKDGQTIRMTQSAFVLENAIGQFINNMGSGGSKGGSSGSSSSSSGGSPSATPDAAESGLRTNNGTPDAAASGGSTNNSPPNGGAGKENQ
jgi:phospholipid/cholesterol/gamma-HCH transport system substrate-binding protein